MASRHSPTRKVSVNASRSIPSESLDSLLLARVLATRMAIVEVVETLRVREPPRRA